MNIFNIANFRMKRQNMFDVANPVGSGRVDRNPVGFDQIEIDAELQSLVIPFSFSNCLKIQNNFF